MSGKSTTPDLQNVLEGNLANMFMKLLDWFLIKGERERERERERVTRIQNPQYMHETLTLKKNYDMVLPSLV